MMGSPPGADSPSAAGLRRRFLRLAALNILTNVTVPVASLVDTAILGHLPDIRFLGGVALAAVLFEYVYWSFGFLRMGTTGTTAQAVGRGETDEVWRVLYRSLLVAGGCGLALLVLQRPLEALGFSLLTASPEVESAGRAYFRARIWGAPAALANFALLGWFLGREDASSPLLATVVANLTNIALDLWLIVGLGWAAFGAGVATAVSQFVMLAVALALLVRRYRPRRWVWREVLDRPSLAALVRLNGDILIRTVSLVTAFALFLNWSAALGTVVLTANTVLSRLQTLVAYLVDGVAFATESLAGRLHGAGDEAGLARLRRGALGTGVAFALPFVVAIVVLPGPVLRLLTSHGPTLETAAELAPWLVPVLLIGSVAYVFDGYFLGLTASRPLRNAMVVSTFGVFVPLAAWALRTGSAHGLWGAMAAFMVARAATLAWAERRWLRS